MEIKYIVPVLGVVLGWLLSQLSGAFLLAREDRRLRSSAIPPMMDLYFQQYRIDKILEFFNLKLGDSLEQLHQLAEAGKIPKQHRETIFNQLFTAFEKTRQVNVDLPSKNKETLFSSIEKAVDSLSKVDAISAYKLSRLSNEFALMLEIKFPEEQLNPKHYLEVHGNLLSIFRSDIINLRSLILKNAFKVGIVELIKIYLLLKSEEKQLNDTPKDVIEEVIKSTKTNKSSQQDASKTGASA